MSLTETDRAKLLVELASKIADKFFPRDSDFSDYIELRGLLIEFAEEIKRQAIEP